MGVRPIQPTKSYPLAKPVVRPKTPVTQGSLIRSGVKTPSGKIQSSTDDSVTTGNRFEKGSIIDVFV